MSKDLVKMDRGITTRDDLMAHERSQTAETAMAAVAARERALIEAQYIMAERHPRNWLDVRGRLLAHCERPGFADVSRYARPVGKEKNDETGKWEEKMARGFTIRFMETAAQEMKNVKPDVAVTYEDDLLRIIRISVTDLEANLTWSREVAIAKTTEKRATKDGSAPPGRDIISSRINSSGDTTFLVRATEAELRAKVNSETSKTHRDMLQKICPRDILEECEQRVAATIQKADKADPKAALKKILDAFDALGVKPSDLVNYTGKPESQWLEADRQDLRELYSAIKEGEMSFAEALKARATPADEEQVQDRDERAEARLADLKRQGQAAGMTVAADVVNALIDARCAEAQPEPSDAAELSEEEMARQQAEADAHQEQAPKPRRAMTLPGRKP